MGCGTEIFTYLGCKNRVNFFLHTAPGNTLDDKFVFLCGGVYDTMVLNNLLAKEDKIVVFDVTPERFLPVFVDHDEFSGHDFEPGELGTIFRDLFAEERDEKKELFIIEALLFGDKAGEFNLHIIFPNPGILETFRRLSQFGAPVMAPMLEITGGRSK